MILLFRKTLPLKKACMLFFFTLHCFLNAQNKETDVYQTFDALIGLENSGIFKGTVNLPYPNVRPDNHPFFGTAEYVQLVITYGQQTYSNIDGRYDLLKNTLEILPKKQTNLPPITLAPELLQGFILNGAAFEKFILPKSEEISFFEVLLSNTDFKLLQKHQKQGKERIRNRNQIYIQYVESSSLFILTQGQMYPLNGKKDLLKLFPQAKEQLNEYYKASRETKKGNSALIDVLRKWNDQINQKDS